MAMKLNAGETGRQDLFSIFPENIVVNPGENGRKEPHSQEEIESLARSILEYTQLEPVVVRRIHKAPDKATRPSSTSTPSCSPATR